MEQKKKSLWNFVTSYCQQHKTQAEILRFVIVGGIATLIDFFITGVVLYLFNPKLYPHFYNVFYGGGEPSVLATVISTGIGFTVSLIVNYILSIVFVFQEKGNSKSKKGFLLFAVLSIIGLLINMGGMYVGYDLLHINEWITKILMTCLVLVYNYVTRKLLIFKKHEQQVADSSQVLQSTKIVDKEQFAMEQNSVQVESSIPTDNDKTQRE